MLHCNLNVRSMVAAAPVYEQGLGLAVRMRTSSRGADGAAMGLPGPTDSDVWFLYDHRGGRRCPAVELVEWKSPATEGTAYDDLAAAGMQAIGFAVPSLADTSKRLLDTGARETSRSALADGRVMVGAEFLDADGVRIELVEDPSVPAPTFRYVRMNCADLAATTGWYEAVGWQPTRSPLTVRWSDATADVAIQPVALPADPAFALHLTTSPEAGSPDAANRRAHDQAHHRGLYRMALAVDDLRAAVAAARADGRVLPGEPAYMALPGTPLGGLWVSFFTDPDGVTVEFVERPDVTR